MCFGGFSVLLWNNKMWRQEDLGIKPPNQYSLPALPPPAATRVLMTENIFSKPGYRVRGLHDKTLNSTRRSTPGGSRASCLNLAESSQCKQAAANITVLSLPEIDPIQARHWFVSVSKGLGRIDGLLRSDSAQAACIQEESNWVMNSFER